MSDEVSKEQLPDTCLPQWDVADLPQPTPLGLRNLAGFIGPGIVMCGIQIAGGEWLFGAEITARYGGGLMWIATIAIIGQVFYNMECGRYALYCGEPVFTGFMRSRPGPTFWISVLILLSFGAFIPGLSTHGATVVAAFWLDRPPTADDKLLVNTLAYVLLGLVTLPILVGGKIYNTIQAIMTTKVFVVLGFCLFIGVFFVSAENWANVFSGFFKIGNVPVETSDGETVENVFTYYLQNGELPMIAMANIALLGAFAGYAGGGGLGNATYSNYCRDKGWGMGSLVGAIPSAVGGRKITLSHLGTVFPLTRENLDRWKGWWRYIITDQVFIWGPGCFAGMALPALISIQFSQYSPMYGVQEKLDWAQAIISADGIRHAPGFSETATQALWLITLFVGLIVLLPSQLSIVEDVCRKWTDIIWSGNSSVRANMKSHQVNRIYYTILAIYVVWSFICAYLFTTYGKPRVMTIVIANLNNVAMGLTAFLLLRINLTMLPKELKPKIHNIIGVACCGIFYLGLAGLVFYNVQLPYILELLGTK